MSTYSDAWHNTPPAVRDFYRNYHRRNCAHCWKAEWSALLGAWVPFNMIGWSFLGYSGFAIAYTNWAHQILARGSFDPAIVLVTDDPDFPPPDLQPLGPGLSMGAYPDQFVAVPDWADNYPREKYKVRRQYWTGKPRHRRNL